jgi:hypothetical protein
VNPLAWIFIGALVYLMVWFWHENSRVGVGAWRPPGVVRSLLRFREGPVYPSGVAVEVWGLSMVVAGLLGQVGVLDPSLEARLLVASIYGAIPLGIIWVSLFLAHWLRTRPSRP